MGREEYTDDDGGNPHDHYCFVFDICSESHYVSVQCLHCGGEIDGFEFFYGAYIVERQRLLDSLGVHSQWCPAEAIFEESDDDD